MLTKSYNKLTKYLLKLLLTIGMFVLLSRIVDWKAVGQTITQAQWHWLGLMYLCMLMRRSFDALQMKIILQKVGVYVTFQRTFLANALSALYSLIVPGDLVASGAKFTNLAAATGEKSIVLNAIVYNRISLMLPILFIGSAILAWENPAPESYLTPVMLTTTFLLAALCLCLYHPGLEKIVDQSVRQISRFQPHSIASKCSYVLNALDRFRQFKTADHMIILGIVLLGLTSQAGLFMCGSRALNIDIPISRALWIIALLAATRQMPITLGNLGIREGLLIFVLGQFEISAATALSLGLILFSNHLLAACIGAVYQMMLLTGLAKWNLSKNP